MKAVTRLSMFQRRCQEHLVYRRLVKKLSADELNLIVRFIEGHDSLDHNAFELAVNRMFLDKPKTKSWPIVQELLSMTNYATRGTGYQNPVHRQR